MLLAVELGKMTITMLSVNCFKLILVHLKCLECLVYLQTFDLKSPKPLLNTVVVVPHRTYHRANVSSERGASAVTCAVCKHLHLRHFRLKRFQKRTVSLSLSFPLLSRAAVCGYVSPPPPYHSPAPYLSTCLPSWRQTHLLLLFGCGLSLTVSNRSCLQFGAAADRRQPKH